MRVAVSGAHGVGKTTFCNDLAAAFKGRSKSVEVLTNVSRDLHAEGVAINEGTEESEYPLFLEKHLTNLFEKGESEYIIHDRTMVDTVSYAIANGNLHQRWISFLLKATPHLLTGVDRYFYIPIEFEIEDDGLRATGKEYQISVDRAVVDILQKCRPDAITLTGSREERVAQALKHIDL